VFVKQPVFSFFKQNAGDNALSIDGGHSVLVVDEALFCVIVNLVDRNLTFVSEDALATFDFELLQLDVLAFEVIESM